MQHSFVNISLKSPSTGNSSVFSTRIQTHDVSKIGRDPSFYSNIDPDFKWMRDSVNYLIHLVSIHFDEFYDKTLKKKVLWKKIAEEMKLAGYAKCTADDCDKKWRNIKKSYVSVLQKQVQGDFSSKFPYFDQMHAFLGREIDPLGMRDSRLKEAINKNKVTDQDEFPRIPFYEVIEDDNFMWSESAVHRLLDLVLEHREIFRINKDVDIVWESIASKMSDEGYNVHGEQCQRKWLNLSEGFRHHQAEAEATGIPPKWSFFPRVRTVINTFNVPVTVLQGQRSAPNIKGSLTSSFLSKEQQFSAFNRSRKRKRSETIVRSRETDDEEEEEEEEEEDKRFDDLPRNFFGALRRLHKKLRAEERLSHLETRIEAAHKMKAAAKHSNNMLSLILGELKRINKSFEHRKEQFLKEQEEEMRLKEERILLNHVDSSASIVDDATCQQAILNMHGITNFHFMKAPKVELVEGNENDGIIIVEGLS
ncbi:hypothetical protein Anas_03875 [Armadillidium nasatum]|uniref:Myb/SANT-like DNA-binding domain-containing protein n=1 Tax=Armadillidium nasatum TaxID=96803 RepID=A0A5N5T2S0_9CRUS|nr:hypothetical protein Anas_03875 [Armadillidium nasatum]